MKTVLYSALALAMLGLTACGGPQSPPSANTPVDGAESAPQPAPAQVSETGSPATPASTEPIVGGLPGTTWEFTGLTITFYEDDALKVKGGIIGEEGLDGIYTLDGSVVKFSVGGQEYSGNFNGSELTIDGQPATRVK